jgi:hypothetical protein
VHPPLAPISSLTTILPQPYSRSGVAHVADSAPFRLASSLRLILDEHSIWATWRSMARRSAAVEPTRPSANLRELFPRTGFIVTNMTLPSRSVVRFYNKRGTAEQWIKG